MYFMLTHEELSAKKQAVQKHLQFQHEFKLSKLDQGHKPCLSKHLQFQHEFKQSKLPSFQFEQAFADLQQGQAYKPCEIGHYRREYGLDSEIWEVGTVKVRKVRYSQHIETSVLLPLCR